MKISDCRAGDQIYLAKEKSSDGWRHLYAVGTKANIVRVEPHLFGGFIKIIWEGGAPNDVYPECFEHCNLSPFDKELRSYLSRELSE